MQSFEAAYDQPRVSKASLGQHVVSAYMTCTGGLQGLELVSVCRHLPQAVLARGPVRHALKTYCALTRGDVGLFLKLHRQAAWRQQTLTKVKLQQASDLLLCLHDSSNPPSV